VGAAWGAGGGGRGGAPRLEIDACTQPLPDEEALNWAQEWVTML
jgi:MioC protein